MTKLHNPYIYSDREKYIFLDWTKDNNQSFTICLNENLEESEWAYVNDKNNIEVSGKLPPRMIKYLKEYFEEE